MLTQVVDHGQNGETVIIGLILRRYAFFLSSLPLSPCHVYFQELTFLLFSQPPHCTPSVKGGFSKQSISMWPKRRLKQVSSSLI